MAFSPAGTFDLNLPAPAPDDQQGGHEEAENADEEHQELLQEWQGILQELQEYGVYADHVDIEFDEEELAASENEDVVKEQAANRFKNLPDRRRQHIYEALLESSDRGTLRKNSTHIVAENFQINVRTMQRIWQRAKECRHQGVDVDVSSRKRKNCGRKKMEVDLHGVPNISLHLRTTIRSLASQIGVSKSTLHRLFKAHKLRRHSNSMKSLLTEANKVERLQWCLKMMDESTLADQPRFIEMDNIIHLDEKWFNAVQKYKRVYLLPEEEDPHRTVQNKNSIDKIMFLSVIAKPRFNSKNVCTFDGKLGLWTFIIKEPAQRRSRNRERGTLVTKTIKVDRDAVRSYLIAKVLPAIVERWPEDDRARTIWIQQDNAPSHVPTSDEYFAFAVSQTGLDIQLICQPPNSPYLNALDLGFFAFLQSLAYTRPARNMDELIENVWQEYDNYDPTKLRRVFLTLQGCLLQVMKDNGDNRYKILHMNKGNLEALGVLPTRLECDRQLYEAVMEALGN